MRNCVFSLLAVSSVALLRYNRDCFKRFSAFFIVYSLLWLVWIIPWVCVKVNRHFAILVEQQRGMSIEA